MARTLSPLGNNPNPHEISRRSSHCLLLVYVSRILLVLVRRCRTNQVRSGTRQFRGNRSCILLCIRHGGINSGFVLLQKVFQEGVIQELGALGLREHCPEQKGQLEGVVKGDPVEKNVDKDLDNGEKGKNDPVDQPLRIVALVFGFNRLEGLEGGVEKAHKTAERGNAHAKDNKESKQKASAQDDKLLGNFGLVLYRSSK
jgi:hypothetical protein